MHPDIRRRKQSPKYAASALAPRRRPHRPQLPATFPFGRAPRHSQKRLRASALSARQGASAQLPSLRYAVLSAAGAPRSALPLAHPPSPGARFLPGRNLPITLHCLLRIAAPLPAAELAFQCRRGAFPLLMEGAADLAPRPILPQRLTSAQPPNRSGWRSRE